LRKGSDGSEGFRSCGRGFPSKIPGEELFPLSEDLEEEALPPDPFPVELGVVFFSAGAGMVVAFLDTFGGGLIGALDFFGAADTLVLGTGGFDD
jgi:hypothetical protein